MIEIEVVDSHTGGEPTRIVLSGAPRLSGASVREMAADFQRNHSAYRAAVIEEPRGSDILVGGILVPPESPDAAYGVIFFNDAGVLGMCGHGTIGLVETLRYLGRIHPGPISFDTPVGKVEAVLHDDRRVSMKNVAARRFRKGLTVEVPGIGAITGDVAYGGNWFFLAEPENLEIDRDRIEPLMVLSKKIRFELARHSITGEFGEPIEHVGLYGKPSREGLDSRNFVLCPGGAYDRSPCGTGTSAKLACLREDGLLQPGQVWRQESVTGSVFEGSVEVENGQIFPIITGQAFVTARSTLLFDPSDDLRKFDI